MNIGILVTSIGNFGQKGFYNAQEIGLAKALSQKTKSVIIYKLVAAEETRRIENIVGYPNVKLHLIPSDNIGINGILSTEELDERLSALIHFSDTQFSVPVAHRWCVANHVQYIPYIGVIESHSTSKIKQWITNYKFKQNLSVYRKCFCCVKTPFVKDNLKRFGIERTIVTPVGLDTDLLRKDFEQFNRIELKKKYGYQQDDKVLLFIGRLIEEKQPVRMIELLSEIRERDKSYKLLMVGSGELKTAIEAKISQLNMFEHIQIIERIPNNEIWELYRFADAFVNLNQHEIFGMAILEAMYYGCKVVAWEAPGPNYVIENGKSGWLVKSNEEAVRTIIDLQETQILENANARVINHFTWNSSADKIYTILGEKNE